MKKTKNKAKLYFALGSVAVLTIIVGYALLAQKRVNVELSESQAAIKTQISQSSSAASSLFKGSGLWITKGSIDSGNKFLTDPVFDWYASSGANWDYLVSSGIVSTGKPIILDYTGETEAGLKTAIDKYEGKVRAVVWDYEKRTVGPTASVKKYANEHGMLLGHVASDTPTNTLRDVKIDYNDTSISDFLMPLWYCQWPSWGCNKTSPDSYKKWASWSNSPVTVIPTVAIQTTGSGAAGVTLTPQQLTNNYGSFNPKPTAIAYWNPATLDAGLVSAIAKVEGTALPTVASIFKGSGCYTTEKTDIGNALVNSSVFDWYVVKGENMDKAAVKKLNRPIAMAQKNKTADELEALIDKYSSRIKAVIWDYEVAGTSQSKAESDLTAIYKYAHSKGLLFGVVTFPNVQTSINYGVDYGRAKNFADFLMPMIYCQWPALGGGCGDPNNKVKSRWVEDNGATSVPLVPLVAIQTTGNGVEGVTVTPQQVIDNYGYLQPKPMTIGYWNPVLTQDLVNAIDKVESGTLNPKDNQVFNTMKETVSSALKCLKDEKDPSRKLNAMNSDDNGNFSSICSVGSYPAWRDLTTDIGWLVTGTIPKRLNRQQLMEVPGKNVQGWYWCTVGKSYSSHPAEPNSCGYYKDGYAEDGSGDGNAPCGGDIATGKFCYALQNKDKFIWCTEKGCQKEGF